MLKKCITTAIVSDNLRILHLLHHLSDKVGSLRAILESVLKKMMFQKKSLYHLQGSILHFSIIRHNIIPTNLDAYRSIDINR